MSCPICGEHCRCAEPRAYSTRNVTFVDVDEYDPSEEQFASSVMTGVTSQEDEQELASGTLASAREKYSHIRQEPQAGLPLPTSYAGPPNLQNPHQAQEEWRNEVASRLQSYKARRRRSMGDNATMSFNFESTAGNHVFLQPELDPLATSYAEPEPAPNYYAPDANATQPAFQEPIAESTDLLTPDMQVHEDFVEPEPEPKPKAASMFETAKLIFFPKPPVSQEMRSDELADPVFETPRILDAPEEVEQVAIPLADITLNPQEEEDSCVPYIEPTTEFHSRIAPVQQRVIAEVLDTLLVLLGSLTFAITATKLNPALLTVEKHAMAGIVILAPAIFWAIYKYLFLVHGGRTVGMRMAQLQLVSFDGNPAKAVVRRYRALAMLVSIFPLGLGLLWSFVDADKLCWHDRISRTYMTPR